MLRTGNPVFNQAVLMRERAFSMGDAMTVQGTVNKAFVLLFLLVMSASWVWGKVMAVDPVLDPTVMATQVSAHVMPFIWGGMIGGGILAFVTIFKAVWSPFTAPLYALCEGLVLGGISAIFEQSYPGIVMQAVVLTFGTLFVMLFLYTAKIVKVTPRFMQGMLAATGAVALVYFGQLILGLFGVRIPFIFSNGPGGILFSLVVCGIAAFNLILDFFSIEEGARLGAQKYMEWYGAFGLMVTLIWLYMEILRLVAKMTSRRG